ncbi:YfiR family protein [Massilia sp. PWRC2]|uniref:YfiR family protein n=1 Tax=Massilia sp. PWRC2 TaxID=2804626 RepID=UPI003CEB952B
MTLNHSDNPGSVADLCRRLPGLPKWLLLAVLTGMLAPALGRQYEHGGASLALERSVKAGFLTKFLSYAEFPPHAFAGPGAALVIGVYGADALAHEVGRMVAGRTINGRPVSVRLLHENDEPVAVHLLFVAGTDSAMVTHILQQWSPAPILLVSECSHGLQAGSAINFRVIEHQVRFDVAVDAAEKNSIKLSSRLLSVANHVIKGVP